MTSSTRLFSDSSTSGLRADVGRFAEVAPRPGLYHFTIHNHIQGIDELVRLLKRRHEGLICLNKAQLDAAYDHFHRRKSGVAGTVRAIGRFLDERKLLAEEPRKAVRHSERELELFGAYLRDVRRRETIEIARNEVTNRYKARLLSWF